MTDTLELKCMVCHKNFPINTNNRKLYESNIIKDNAVCPKCSTHINRIKMLLECSKCGHKFQTRILTENKEKYANGWKCPLCIDNNIEKEEIKGKFIELNCAGCQLQRGVCSQPKLNCTLSKNMVAFNSSDLYSVERECTMMSIHNVDKHRDDIHCFGYTLLYKSEYMISRDNSILLKQRIGSKKKFITNIVVYRYNQKLHKFGLALDEKFKKGKDWIVPIKKFLLIKMD